MSRAAFSLPPIADTVPSGPRTVDELSVLIKTTITSAPSLRNLAVRGELQNFKRHGSGHVYFTLLGRESRVSAVLFRSNAAYILTWPEDGDEVMVTGSVDVYPKGGTYQLYATRILPLGTGAKSRAKESLRTVLEEEGLFDIRHKRPLPKYPSKVAVITSPTGAALQDILEVSVNRSPFTDIVILPAIVQGADAPGQIARALAMVCRLRDADCVILARGGGAKDDLSPFDDEHVVRAVRSCPIPVVTGVGHQTDSSLADLAADAALPTPSAAAERVFPDRDEIRALLSHRLDAISSGALRTLERFEMKTERFSEKLNGKMRAVLWDLEASVSQAERRTARGIERVIERSEAALASSAASLNALSPLSAMSRGYAICCDQGGRVIKSATEIRAGDEINLRFKDGSAEATITSVTDAAVMTDA
ncbi:MAG: exodeoxyribonuclease VII large subunit [Synergistaceae bacterium]|jgi:exodeoxyribonuclease VII large subunit|nr:exodeoxyribonuclease VII large subunit [Synergistaceae bacterium]